MIFSYRTRRFLGRFFRVMLTVAVIAVIVLLCWLLWLQRFVVYTDDGIRLDFSAAAPSQGVVAQPGESKPPVHIQHWEEDDQPKPDMDTLLSGYYVNKETLLSDPALVRAQMEALPAGTPVLMDVKNLRGYFFYSTSAGLETYKYAAISEIDELIDWLGNSNLYAIARLPALSDYVYGISNPPAGLSMSSGALYFDENRCYWLNPAHEDTMTYLIQIVRELRNLGFDEVVFEEFCFPETDKIVYTGDRYLALMEGAQTLVSACATDSFTVSFATDDVNFPLPTVRSRLYLCNVEAADAADVAAKLPEAIRTNRLVFLAENTDNRYNAFGVLRPIELADVES